MANDIEEKYKRQTIGFRVAEAERKEKDMAYIVHEVLQEVCGVTAADILCLQDLPAQGIYDVTFRDAPVCAGALARLRAAAAEGNGALGGIELCQGRVRRAVEVTVQVYNPFRSECAVANFLHVYCEWVTEGMKLGDGYWNGRRRFAVALEADEGGIGGTRHPPAVFSLGSDIGFLYYPGQPKFCSTCSAFGHFSPDCPQYRGDTDDDTVGRFPTRLQAEQDWRAYAENPEPDDLILEYQEAAPRVGAQ